MHAQNSLHGWYLRQTETDQIHGRHRTVFHNKSGKAIWENNYTQTIKGIPERRISGRQPGFSAIRYRQIPRWEYIFIDLWEVFLQTLKRSSSYDTSQEFTEVYERFEALNSVCGASLLPVVLIIDEVDSASNNQVFLDFLPNWETAI